MCILGCPSHGHENAYLNKKKYYRGNLDLFLSFRYESFVSYLFNTHVIYMSYAYYTYIPLTL